MKSYTRHYVWQRITAIILLFLVPWFLWFLLKINGLKYFEVQRMLENPTYRSLIFLMLISGFYHGYLGIKTICLDYLPRSKIRCTILLFTAVVFIFFSLLTAMHLIQLGYPA
jgi:succinate dehydrogenase / fumarate reductase membrane anchor subunit